MMIEPYQIAHIDFEKVSWIVDTDATTVLVAFDNKFLPADVSADRFVCLFSLFAGFDFEICLGLSGKHDGELVARTLQLVGDGYKVEYIRTHRLLTKGVSAIIVVYHRGRLEIFIDGFSTIEVDTAYHKFSRCYIGSCEISIVGDEFIQTRVEGRLGGALQQVVVVPRALHLTEVLRKTLMLVTDHKAFGIRRHLPALKDVTPRIEEFLKAREDDESLQKLLKEMPFALDRVLADFAKKKAFVEAEVRDKVHDLLLTAQSKNRREAFESSGIADLLVSYPETNSQRTTCKDFLVEFKIWGRSGYQDLPSQPLSYMLDNHDVGVAVMIDTRVRPNITSFQEIIRANPSFKCLELSTSAHFSTDIPYFCSLHQDDRFSNPRLIINFYLHIPKPNKRRRDVDGHSDNT